MEWPIVVNLLKFNKYYARVNSRSNHPPLIDPNIYTSHTIGPTSFNEFNIYDEFRNIQVTGLAF
jgi:hypothetical protein